MHGARLFGQTAAMATTPPGWYPDPSSGPGALRYWTGTEWSMQVALPSTVKVPPLPPAPRPPHPTLPVQVAIGALLSLAVPLVASRSLIRWLADYRWPIAVYIVILGLLAYGPPLLYWRWAIKRWGSGNPRADVGFTARWVDCGWGPVTWLAQIGALMAMAMIIRLLHIPFQGNTEGINKLRDNHAYVVTILIVAVIAAPIVEEIVFRGLVMRGFLSVMPAWLAVGLQGVLFGCAHYDPSRGMGNIGLIMVLSAMGVMLGGSSYLLRRLASNMIAHGIHNTIAMVINLVSGMTLPLVLISV